MAREELIDRASAGTVLTDGSMRVDAESVGTWFWGGGGGLVRSMEGKTKMDKH